jgi:ABC-2 type transport system permease protein
MSALRLLARQVGYEQRTYWRTPSSAFFTFAFPLVLLFIFTTMYRSTSIAALGGVSYAQYFVPGIVAFGVISACYTNIAITLCFRRDMGVLKRLRGTPLPPWVFMGGHVGSSLVVSALLTVITTAVGVLLYDVRVPAHPVALAASLVLGSFCFCALGLAVTALIRNAHASPAVVNGALFPLLFISGTFFPLEPGSMLDRIASFFPVRHFQHAVFTAFDARPPGADTTSLVAMLAWGLAALVFAVRRFRWEPHHR